MKAKPILLLTCLMCMAFFTNAQMPLIKVKTVNNQEANVGLQALDIDVQLMGNIAQTVMTMTFYNPNNRVLEGELTFPMPDGVSLSQYALDINGKMRAAVPIEKAKATAVFESITHRRVDPGILEKVEGNQFRTRIYPIPAKGSRTITVGYEEELKLDKGNNMRFHLPLAYAQPIAKFSLKTTVFESVVKPELLAQPDGSFTLQAIGNHYTAEMKKTNYQPTKGLTINLPKVARLPEVQLQKANTGAYFLVNVYPKTASRPRPWSNKIGLIWDTSLSGLQRDLKKELALLDLLIKRQKNLVIELGLLNHTFTHAGTFAISGGDWAALKAKLEKLVYDGGTNFSAIDPNTLNANEYLFFTDGLSTFGKNSVALSRPVHLINSAQKADYSTLKYIGLKTNGSFTNLNTTEVVQAFKQLNEEQLQYLGIKNGADVRHAYPSLPMPVNGQLSVAGILSAYSTHITLQFGYGHTVTSEQTVSLNPSAQSLTGIDISRIWAQKKIAEMDIQYERNKAEITQLGKQFGLVTRNTSLIVLENLDDYLRYGLTPPTELRTAYEQALKQRKIDLNVYQTNLVQKAIAMSQTLKTWWKTDFSKAKQKEILFPKPIMMEDRTNETVVYDQSPNVDRIMMPSRNLDTKQESTASALQGRVAGIQIDATSRKKSQQALIYVPVFKSDKAYMKVLNGSSAQAYQKYLAIRPSYLHTPTFYFDVANWFYQHGAATTALTILSNIADLELENADLYKVLAYQLKKTGNYHDALYMTEKIMQWRPMDAQSYRDHALVLTDLGQYQLALDNLQQVLTQSYYLEATDRDEGIEEIILTEMNNLITKYGNKLNTSKIDKRLIQNLPVDIRVVLNWNKNDTDIDLWLTDPNGEKCYYGNQTTAIGGRISNDFTAGYGPEQFMLKKAIKGKYKIEVNYYGDSQMSISGPTTVTAEIYTHYATAQQQRKIIVVPLDRANANGNLVGEFSF